jgi:hypothetical protein
MQKRDVRSDAPIPRKQQTEARNPVLSLRNRKFESISLQERVHCEIDRIGRDYCRTVEQAIEHRDREFESVFLQRRVERTIRPRCGRRFTRIRFRCFVLSRKETAANASTLAAELMERSTSKSAGDITIRREVKLVNAAERLISLLPSTKIKQVFCRKWDPALSWRESPARRSKGEIPRAVAELAEARGFVGDDRYSSIDRLRAVVSWGAPKELLRHLFCRSTQGRGSGN